MRKTVFHSRQSRAMRLKGGIFAVLPLLGIAACAPMRLGGGGAPQFARPAQTSSLLGADIAALSAAEKREAEAAEYQALEHKKTGEVVQWGGSHASGAVTAGQPYKVGGQNCRQYSHEWRINGAPHSARGSACRNEDGSWTPLV